MRPPANVALLRDLAEVMRRRRLKWYVFGAQAASYYGRPRMTEDVDVTVRVPNGRLRGLVKALGKATFVPRVDNVEAFVARARVIPFFHRRTSMPLDLVLAADGLEEQFLERAIRVDLGGVKVPILTPEDVIITRSSLEDRKTCSMSGRFSTCARTLSIYAASAASSPTLTKPSVTSISSCRSKPF